MLIRIRTFTVRFELRLGPAAAVKIVFSNGRRVKL